MLDNITLAAILTEVHFEPMTAMDLEGFPGIEGDGFLGDIHECNCTAIMDVMETEIVIQVVDENGMSKSWIIPQTPTC